MHYSTDRDFDHKLAINWLMNTDWGVRRGRTLVQKSLLNSYILHASDQRIMVGFIRVVTDFSFFGHIGDVYVDVPWRRRGIGSQLIGEVMRSKVFESVTNWHATSDEREFFQKLGFSPINPERNFVLRRNRNYSLED